MRVHLIDGTFELFRSFYGGPSRKSAAGVEVGAARTFARSLQKLLSQPDVSHVAVAFDTVIESFRNQLFDGYKTGEGIDPELWGQAPMVEEAAAALGLTVWSMLEFETDDALATAAARFGEDPAVEQVLICSPDKDFAQCVGGRVVMWDRIRDVTYDEAGVREKWGIAPSSMPDYLALVGDDADGIPGVPKWGAKSSSTVLNHYHHIESIPEDASEWQVQVRGAKGLAASLDEHREAVGLYKTLATLRRDVPLEEDLEALRYAGPDSKRLEAFWQSVN
ncbi:MAG: 5'-3' exonuclease H3TH domain-containing protein [Myxococcota bacterium]